MGKSSPNSIPHSLSGTRWVPSTPSFRSWKVQPLGHRGPLRPRDGSTADWRPAHSPLRPSLGPLLPPSFPRFRPTLFHIDDLSLISGASETLRPTRSWVCRRPSGARLRREKERDPGNNSRRRRPRARTGGQGGGGLQWGWREYYKTKRGPDKRWWLKVVRGTTARPLPPPSPKPLGSGLRGPPGTFEKAQRPWTSGPSFRATGSDGVSQRTT